MEEHPPSWLKDQENEAAARQLDYVSEVAEGLHSCSQRRRREEPQDNEGESRTKVEDYFTIGTSTRSEVSSAHNACYAGADCAIELNPRVDYESRRRNDNKSSYHSTSEAQHRGGVKAKISTTRRRYRSVETNNTLVIYLKL